MSHRSTHAFLVASLVPFLVPPALAQCEVDELSASALQAFGHVGWSAAISGDVAVVGAIGVNDYEGAAYVFERVGSDWQQTAELVDQNGDLFHYFGQSVAATGDTVLVGTPWGDGGAPQSGAVHVFERSGSSWQLTGILQHADAVTHDYLGYALGLEGDRLIVGAPFKVGTFHNQGAAYVFERAGSSWTQTAKLIAGDPGEWSQFGSAVAISGDTIVVGSPTSDPNGPPCACGEAYVFELEGSNWVQVQKLVPAEIAPDDWFGISVAVEGDWILAGAPRNPLAGIYSGAAFLFERGDDGWSQTGLLMGHDVDASDQFGFAMALDDGRALVSSTAGAPGVAAPSVYVFERTGSEWRETSRLLRPSAFEGNQFGYAVDLDGDRALVGAISVDSGGVNQSGAAYVFDELDYVATAYCATAPNSTGDAARIASMGSNSVAEDDLVLCALRAKAGQFGLFYYGPEQVQIPFGEGFRCVGSGSLGLFRLYPPILISSAGTAQRPIDFSRPPTGSGPGRIDPGSTWNFQFWYRDPTGGPAGFNLSDALAIGFCP